MKKWIVAVILALFFFVCSVAYLYSIALRDAAIIQGRIQLKMAVKDFANYGCFPDHGSGYKVWLSSNVVDISGKQYWCFITTTNNLFVGEGALAITTNQEFIWLDKIRPPKLIGTNYKAPMFPPRF